MKQKKIHWNQYYDRANEYIAQICADNNLDYMADINEVIGSIKKPKIPEYATVERYDIIIKSLTLKAIEIYKEGKM